MAIKFTEAAVDALAQYLAEEDDFVVFPEHVLAQFRPKARAILGILTDKHESQNDTPADTVAMAFRVDRRERDRLTKLAHRRHTTVSALIRAALKNV